MQTLNIKKTLLLLFTLLVPNLSSALIKSKEFKRICYDATEYKVANLKQSLAQVNSDNFYLWLSSFDDTYKSPLIYAIYNASMPIITLLIDTCIKHKIKYWEFTTLDNRSLLSVAASIQNIDAVALLLKYNHPICMDKSNTTSALHQAALKANVPICRLIIAKDSRLIHRQDIKQMTPINYLIEIGKEFYVLELLKNFPVNKNMVSLDMNGRSYLHYAVFNCMSNVVHCLLAEGFNYNQKDYAGVTPLGLAKYQPDESILRILKAEKKNRKYKYLCCLRNTASRSVSEDTYIAFFNPQPNDNYID